MYKQLISDKITDITPIRKWRETEREFSETE